MWQLFNQAKEWGKTPSELIGLDPDDTLTTFCFDEAVLYFGNEVSSRVQEAGKSKGKNDNAKKQESRSRNKLRQCLGMEPKFRAPPSKGR